MGYFKDLEEQRRAYAAKNQPYAGLGTRELRTAEIFGKILSADGEGTAFEETAPAENGIKETRLILRENGVTIAAAKEWEATEYGKKVSYANIVFNKAYNLGGHEGDNKDYTIRKTYNAQGIVSALEENHNRRSIEYYSSGQVIWIEEKHPSGKGLGEKYGMRDHNAFKYNRNGQLLLMSREVCDKGALAGHIEIKRHLIKYEYGKKHGETITLDQDGDKLVEKTETDITKELVHGIPKESGMKHRTERERAFIGEFDEDHSIPDGFTKIRMLTKESLYDGDGKLKTRSLKDERRFEGFYKEKTSYYGNRNISVFESEEFMVNGGSKKEVKTFSEQGKPLREWYSGKNITVSPERIYRTRKDYNPKGDGSLIAEAKWEGTYRKSGFKFIGFVKDINATHIEHIHDRSGKTSLKETGFNLREDANMSVKTEPGEGAALKQTTIIKSPDDNRKYVVEKSFDFGQVIGRKITVNGEEVSGDGFGDTITVKRSEDFYGAGKRQVVISYDDDGNMHSAEETNFDIDGSVVSSASYNCEKDGISLVKRDGDGCVEEYCFYKDDGTYGRERFLCETKYASVFTADGSAKMGGISHNASESFPAAVTYHMETGIVTINTGKDTGINARAIAENLWGDEAAGDDHMAHSPKGMPPKELIDAVQTVENAAEPVVTYERTKEMLEIRSMISGELKNRVLEKNTPVGMLGEIR